MAFRRVVVYYTWAATHLVQELNVGTVELLNSKRKTQQKLSFCTNLFIWCLGSHTNKVKSDIYFTKQLIDTFLQ